MGACQESAPLLQRRERNARSRCRASRPEQRSLDGDGFTQRFAEHGKACQRSAAELVKHFAGDLLAILSVQRVAVDQHWGGQRFEASDSQRVHDACSDCAQINLARGDRERLFGARPPFPQ
jgi:hypothetical protein